MKNSNPINVVSDEILKKAIGMIEANQGEDLLGSESESFWNKFINEMTDEPVKNEKTFNDVAVTIDDLACKELKVEYKRLSLKLIIEGKENAKGSFDSIKVWMIRPLNSKRELAGEVYGDEDETGFKTLDDGIDYVVRMVREAFLLYEKLKSEWK